MDLEHVILLLNLWYLLDPTYAETFLVHAKTLFTFAEKYPGKYSDSITDADGYYR